MVHLQQPSTPSEGARTMQEALPFSSSSYLSHGGLHLVSTRCASRVLSPTGSLSKAGICPRFVLRCKALCRLPSMPFSAAETDIELLPSVMNSAAMPFSSSGICAIAHSNVPSLPTGSEDRSLCCRIFGCMHQHGVVNWKHCLETHPCFQGTNQQCSCWRPCIEAKAHYFLLTKASRASRRPW